MNDVSTDKLLVDRYWARDESVLSEVATLYGPYLFTVANNILSDPEDSEEIVNDTYLSSWNSIPPHRPQILLSFLAKITRRHSIDRYRRRQALKRGSDRYTLALDELGEIVAGCEQTDQALEGQAVADLISGFLAQERAAARQAFVLRYFFGLQIEEIARLLGRGENTVSSILYRTRQKLRALLISEGWLHG